MHQGYVSRGIYRVEEQFGEVRRDEAKSRWEEAKTETTRGRRLAQAIEWVAEGKPRNWKYM